MSKPYRDQMNQIHHQVINMTLLDKKVGNVIGTRGMDTVYLYGKKEFEHTLYANQLTILIKNGCTDQMKVIQLEDAGGYEARLFLGDFTGDGILDVLVSMDTGGSGGYEDYYLYSIKNGNPQLLLDNQSFKLPPFDVTYQDGYRLRVASKELGLRFSIDLSTKDPAYLSQFYDDLGKLKQSTQGEVLAVGLLRPLWDQGTLKLLLVSRIIGTIGADTIAYLNQSLVWDGNQFKLESLNVSILSS